MKEENKEEIKNGEIKTIEGNRVKIRKGPSLAKILAVGIVLLTVSVDGTLLFLNVNNRTPNFTEPATAIVEVAKEDSVIDEVIEIVNTNAISSIDELTKKVELSETLHDLNLEKYIGGLTKFEMPETYSVKEVQEMIAEFEELAKNNKVKNSVLSEEDREFTQLALTLEAYERCVNGSLTNEAYQTLVDYGIPLVKSKVLDACGFDASEVSQMRIGSGSNSYVVSFDDPETGKTYNVVVDKGNAFSSTGYVHDVIGQIYDWQNKSQKAQDTGTSYDGDRNDDIIAGINSLKTLTLMDCEITNSGKITVVTAMDEVKAKEKSISTPTTQNK